MWRKSASQTHNQAARHFALQLRLRSNWISWEVHQFYDFTRSIRRRARAVCQNILEVALFLRNRGSQCLFWGNRATRIGGSIPEESWFTIPICWGIVPPLIRGRRKQRYVGPPFFPHSHSAAGGVQSEHNARVSYKLFPEFYDIMQICFICSLGNRAARFSN